MTRKPYSTESITLNFGSPTLMDGWSVSKEPENRGILLLRDGGYYLGIIDSRAKHAFDAEHVPQDGECYDKMVYRLVSGANKQLPHVFFSAKGVERFNPSDKIMEIYRSGTFKKGKTFSLEDCHALIDYYKTCIEGYEDWNSFDFHFSDTACYADISDFFNEFERQSYLVTFSKVSVSYIDRLVEDGYLYLFRLWHKDFSERSKGVPDLSTLYWRALFDERNIRSTVFKLNGKASILFRRHSIEPGLATVHRANGIIPHKSGQPGESVFAYDIVKDRRFTVDSFLFHASISFNYSARNGGFVNYAVHDLIRAGGVRHILGLHRGEKNLLYYSLIDLNGKIVRQGSLNVVVSENGGVRRETDYRQLLTNRERERDAARRSWQCQQDIKALKAGYLSHIVGTVSSLMVQYDAVAVLEKLDNDFVRSRQAIERNVYRQFEESLIRHLNYHVDKRIGAEEPGGLLRGLQLTNVFESFSKVGFQSGCLFYHPSWKSTRMDPATGFVNMLDTRYVNVSESRIFFSKFDRIEYNSRQDWFEFSFDYGNFGRQLKKSRRQWTVCSHGMCHDTTYDVEKHRWQSSPVVLTTEFRRIFASAGIDVTGNLKDKICQLTEKRFLEPLMHLMGLMLQLCYSSGDGLTDYILSPVQDNNGRFYDSREAPEGMPCDADANAAYNMARRGLASVRSIIASEPGKNVSLGMNNDDWLYFAQHINENDNLIK